MQDIIVALFEKIAKNYYMSKAEVSVTEDPSVTTAYCTAENKIVIPKHLLDEFTANKLPRFTVFYHELGHALFSKVLHRTLDKWKQITLKNMEYGTKYFHLINWIEDLYIEEKMIRTYPFLTDVMSCLKRCKYNYNIDEIDKAFNHYYLKNTVTPALTGADALTFKVSITRLLQYRSSPTFGRGVISLISKKSDETKYIQEIITFYNWCVSKGIFPPDQPLPPLSSPINTIGNAQGSGNSSNSNNGNNGGRGRSKHSGQPVGLIETFPDIDASSTTVFVDLFATEEKMIENELANRSKVESKNESLDGLFNATYSDSAIIQPRVTIKNFYNPNRLVDRVLFKSPNKVFANVSIYRDVSGSTHGGLFKLIDDICKHLIKNIPITTNFYLYSSGEYSIVQVPYMSWTNDSKKPLEYRNNPLVQQLGGGTNSDAIADVITQQLDSKWLNIIVTDGDLDALMEKDNINSLLENVFVIGAHTKIEAFNGKVRSDRFINIESDKELYKINAALNGMRG